MTRTMWIALFCLVGLGPAIAIKVVTRPASVAAAAAQDQAGTAPAPNEAAKSDRLPLPDIRAEAELMPAAEPPEAPPDGVESGIPGRRWQDANAKAPPNESLPRTGSGIETGEEKASNKQAGIPSRFDRTRKAARIVPSEPAHRHTIARPPVETAGNNPPKPREAWHCRQDAMGSVLRSLDLSPRCHM